MLRLAFVTLYTPDVDGMKRWYRDQLGLPLRLDHGSWVEFDTGGATLALHPLERALSARDRAGVRGGRRRAAVHDFGARGVRFDVSPTASRPAPWCASTTPGLAAAALHARRAAPGRRRAAAVAGRGQLPRSARREGLLPQRARPPRGEGVLVVGRVRLRRVARRAAPAHADGARRAPPRPADVARHGGGRRRGVGRRRARSRRRVHDRPARHAVRDDGRRARPRRQHPDRARAGRGGGRDRRRDLAPRSDPQAGPRAGAPPFVVEKPR